MKTKMQGAGLIEVLVALFISVIGLLGILAGQSDAVQSKQRAEYTTEDHLLATDMLNMITAYNSLSDPASARYSNFETETNLSGVDCAAGCNRGQPFFRDRAEWSMQLHSVLPSGYGRVNFDAVSEKFTISVMWDAERVGVTGKNCSANRAVYLSCYVIEVQI